MTNVGKRLLRARGPVFALLSLCLTACGSTGGTSGSGSGGTTGKGGQAGTGAGMLAPREPLGVPAALEGRVRPAAQGLRAPGGRPAPQERWRGR